MNAIRMRSRRDRTEGGVQDQAGRPSIEKIINEKIAVLPAATASAKNEHEKADEFDSYYIHCVLSMRRQSGMTLALLRIGDSLEMIVWIVLITML